MNSFYRVIDSIKDAVSAEPFNHQVTFGDIADIDLQKQSLFPLCHIMINNATITDNLVQQNMTIFLMDLVDSPPITTSNHVSLRKHTLNDANNALTYTRLHCVKIS